MIKKIIRNHTHKLLMPRGRDYISDHQLETGWTKTNQDYKNKQICILYKKTDVKSKGTIILAHPYLAESKQFFLKRGHAEMYLRLGFDVFLFDFNGFGESPFINFAYEEDLMIVAEFAKSINPNQTVSGHGISFGASHTVTYASLNNNVFDNIIIENCLDSNLSYYKKRNKKLHFLMLGLMKIFPKVNKNHDYTKSIKQLKNIKDVLFIYNMQDDLTTMAMGDHLLQNCNKSCTMEIFEGRHLNAYQDNEKRYTEVISSFLGD
jgi:predicted alpha/beta-fold hydrolase